MKKRNWKCSLCSYPMFDKASPPDFCPSCLLQGRGFHSFERWDFVMPVARKRHTKKTQGPAVHGDKLPKHFDWSLGEWVDSKQQRRRRYAASGLVERSMSERRRKFGHRGPERLNVSTSIPGVTPGKRPAHRLQVV